MVGMELSGDVRRRAFENVISSISSSARLPSQVFLGSWGRFLFFESDRLFQPEFAVITARLLKEEQAQVCCLLNFSETDRLVYREAAMLFTDKGTKPSAYDTILRRGGPANGWLFGTDRYGSASDRGEWSIYCEKGNDLAVIAFRSDHSGKYVECLKKLQAEPIREMLKLGSEAPVPFGQLTAPWRHDLVQHYASEGTD
jgi:hypothetical protein